VALIVRYLQAEWAGVVLRKWQLAMLKHMDAIKTTVAADKADESRQFVKVVGAIRRESINPG